MKITKFSPIPMENKLVSLNESSPFPTDEGTEMLDALFKNGEGKLYFEALDKPVKIDAEGNLRKPIEVGRPSTRSIYQTAIAPSRRPRDFWGNGSFDYAGDFKIYDSLHARADKMKLDRDGDEALVVLVFDRTKEKGNSKDALVGAFAYKAPWTMYTATVAAEQKKATEPKSELKLTK